MAIADTSGSQDRTGLRQAYLMPSRGVDERSFAMGHDHEHPAAGTAATRSASIPSRHRPDPAFRRTGSAVRRARALDGAARRRRAQPQRRAWSREAWGASVLARRAPSNLHTYGFRRSTVLAALANAVVLLVAVGAVAWEADGRFRTSTEPHGTTMTWVAAAGVGVNGISALMFSQREQGRRQRPRGVLAPGCRRRRLCWRRVRRRGAVANGMGLGGVPCCGGVDGDTERPGA